MNTNTKEILKETDERKTEVIAFRVTPSLKKKLDNILEAKQKTVSDWIRDIIEAA